MALDPGSPAAVFDRAAPTYDRVGVSFFDRIAEALLERVALQPGEQVVDIGTGRGAVLVPAAHAVGRSGRAVGVDLAPGMVERTAADTAALPQVEVLMGDAADPPVDGPFDAVLSSMMLFFLPDPAASLRRWAGMLAPDGRLGLVTFLLSARMGRMAAVLRSFLPEQTTAWDPSAPAPPFELVADPQWLDRQLHLADLEDVHADVIELDTVFDDIDQWWAWQWSHGGREQLEQVPEDRHDALLAAMRTELEANPLPDGRLGYRSLLRITVARR